MIVSAAPESQSQESEEEGERKREGWWMMKDEREERVESHNCRVPRSHWIHHLNGELNDPVHMALKLRGSVWGGETKWCWSASGTATASNLGIPCEMTNSLSSRWLATVSKLSSLLLLAHTSAEM